LLASAKVRVTLFGSRSIFATHGHTLKPLAAPDPERAALSFVAEGERRVLQRIARELQAETLQVQNPIEKGR
jgi:hypothetical protein